MRLEITTTPMTGPESAPFDVEIDGQRRQDPRLLMYQDAGAVGVWLDRERQYDVEVYVDGQLKMTVPSRTPDMEAQYDALEATGHGPETPRPPFPGTARAQLPTEWDRLLAHPGRALLAKLRRLSRTEKILVGNSQALLAHLARMDDPNQQLSLWDMRNQQGFEGFLDETERHLHNYVAAAQSRVEHFRQFVRNEWVEDSTFRRAYQERVAKEFAVSLLHNFITDLRNFMLHARLTSNPTCMRSPSMWLYSAAWVCPLTNETHPGHSTSPGFAEGLGEVSVDSLAQLRRP